jgi:predicted cupin superfamily sugar epimerase
MTDVAALVRCLELSPHPEGGYFRETFRADPLPFAVPGRGARAASTAIYFLLPSGDFSAFHRVASDEVWHFYGGVPLELHCLNSDGSHEPVRLGPDLLAGERPQYVVRAGIFQAARPSAPGYSLCGCTVAPGFDFADFEMPTRDALLALFPAHAALVRALTRVVAESVSPR